jgi:hypothetical protein
MAPRKSTHVPPKKQKEPQPGELRLDQEWQRSSMMEKNILVLVAKGILPDRATAGWRPSNGEPYPMPNTNEVIVFADYFLRGFGVPRHLFLHRLLDYYEISLCHLHPNSIFHVSIFIHLCEAFLGILPHFNLLRHLFMLMKSSGGGS